MHHVYWQLDNPNSRFSGGVFIESAFGGFVFSARVKIKPNIVIPDPRFFNYLGTHEIGHTFGLDDCLSTKNSTLYCFRLNDYGRTYKLTI
jgi:hypothetical protein